MSLHKARKIHSVAVLFDTITLKAKSKIINFMAAREGAGSKFYKMVLGNNKQMDTVWTHI